MRSFICCKEELVAGNKAQVHVQVNKNVPREKANIDKNE